MATKINHTYSVAVYTLGGGEFTATDSDNAKAGYIAFQQFMHHETVEIPGDGSVTYVPFHAIDHVIVQHSSATAEISDANCVVAESE